MNSSEALLRAERNQIVEAFAKLYVAEGAEPLVDDHSVNNEYRGRLTRHAVEIPYAVVETPLEVVREHRGCAFARRTQVAPTGDGNERYVIEIVVGHLVDDGQLPSAHASPLCPEDQVDGLDLLAENELAARLECKREVGCIWPFGRLVGRFIRRRIL